MTIRARVSLRASISHRLAGAFVLCGLVLCGLVLAAQGSAQAAPGDPSILTLDPTQAPPGSQARAGVAGFDACSPVAEVAVGAGRATFVWDGVQVLGSATLESGAGSIDFTVPAEATPGEHEVRATCDANRKLEVSRTFDVVAPSVQLVAVPDLTGLSPDEATQRLDEVGLVLGQVTGGGGVIQSQNPGPPTRVRTGTEVTVSVEAAVPPRRLVRVPDVVGMGVDEARRTVADLGLALTTAGNDGPNDGTVVAQQPAPGTLVAAGSGVSLRVGADGGLRLLPLVLVLAGIAGAGALAVGYRLTRTRRAKTWTRNHVRVAPEDITEVRSAMAPTGHDPSGDVVVRIEHHLDAGDHRLEEISR